jgi:hypothetical protein
MGVPEIVNKAWNYAHVLRDDGVEVKGLATAQKMDQRCQSYLLIMILLIFSL